MRQRETCVRNAWKRISLPQIVWKRCKKGGNLCSLGAPRVLPKWERVVGSSSTNKVVERCSWHTAEDGTRKSYSNAGLRMAELCQWIENSRKTNCFPPSTHIMPDMDFNKESSSKIPANHGAARVVREQDRLLPAAVIKRLMNECVTLRFFCNASHNSEKSECSGWRSLAGKRRTVFFKVKSNHARSRQSWLRRVKSCFVKIQPENRLLPPFTSCDSSASAES